VQRAPHGAPGADLQIGLVTGEKGQEFDLGSGRFAGLNCSASPLKIRPVT